MSKRFVVILSLMLVFSGSLQAQAVIKETQTHSVFKGVFLSVWSKLRSLNPTSRQDARSSVVYTAGVRGAESTDTLIQPYWKGDLSQDKAFQQELQGFSSAQQLMDNGKLAESANAFGSFLNQHSDSALAPNARFARGLCFAGIGDSGKAKSDFQRFLEDYPNHPLATDANQLMGQL